MTIESELEDSKKTISILRSVPGGTELVDWFAPNPPSFGDSEIVSLHLNRSAPSELKLHVDRNSRYVTVTFVLAQWIDVNLSGFSNQNVIGGLTLRTAPERGAKPWELGVGLESGTVELEFEPCFGAYGTIRARIDSVRFESRNPDEEDDQSRA